MKLYDTPISWNCRKVRAVAAELGLELELHPIDFSKGEVRAPAYLAKNPNGKVPALEDGDLVLWESNAILLYLAAKKPEAGLVPAEPRARADVDRWLFWQASHLGPAFRVFLAERILKPRSGGTPDEAALAAAQRELDRLLPVLEQGLAGKEYVAGRLSVADFSLAAHVALAGPLGISLEAYPEVRAWVGRITARESWKRSAPPAS